MNDILTFLVGIITGIMLVVILTINLNNQKNDD